MTSSLIGFPASPPDPLLDDPTPQNEWFVETARFRNKKGYAKVRRNPYSRKESWTWEVQRWEEESYTVTHRSLVTYWGSAATMAEAQNEARRALEAGSPDEQTVESSES